MQHGEELVIQGTAFDVPPDNYDDFDQKLEQSKLGDWLIQKNPLKGSVREYRYYAPVFLLLNFVAKKNAKVKNFRVNLACMSPEPEHHKVIVWKWLYSTLSAGILAALSFVLAGSNVITSATQLIKPEYFNVAGTVLLTIALICALIFVYQMRDEYFFKSRFGNVKLFLIENRKPDIETFNKFFSGLQINILKAQSKSSVRNCLINELKMCRRLRDEGIIDDEAYTMARTMIFRHEQY